MKSAALWLGCLGVLAAPLVHSEPVAVGFEQGNGELVITVDGRHVASYCYRDNTITRPYFAHLRAPCGVQVTRNHPPQECDAQDHENMHPGLWLAFGDISGNDYWRLKAKVECGTFVEPAAGGPGKGRFAVRNRYLGVDGESEVCTEICTYSFVVVPQGYLLICDSSFSCGRGDFYFGDQEEMGLGVRVATPMAVKSGKGGRIFDSAGRCNECEIWGKRARWCDYSGFVEGQRAGLCIMPHPGNFRECWGHVRDYGFMAANPFGVHAMTGGPKSRIVVKEEEVLRLRYGVLIHDGFEDPRAALEEAYRYYVEVVK